MAGKSGAVRAGRAFVELFADDSKLVKGLRRAQRRLSNFGSAIRGIGGQMLAGAAAAAAPFAVAVKAASDLQEQMNKFKVVFGNNADAMKQWADTFSTEVGRSKRQTVEFLAGFQDLLVPVGVDPKTAETSSKMLTRLAVDLASFNNLNDADVVRDLQAALTGSSETMKKYGVVVGMTAVNQELLNMGLKPKKATEAQKAMARLNVIMRDTSAAQGDATRSSGSFANRLKSVKARLEDAAASIGAALLPALADILGRVSKVITMFATWAANNQPLIKTIAAVIAGVAAAGLALVVAGSAASALSAIIGLAVTVWTGLGAAVGVVGAMLGALLSPIGLIIAAVVALSTLFVDWGQVAADVTQAAGEEFQGFKKRATAAWGGIRNAIASGDLGLAFKIVTLLMKSEWLRLMGALKGKWLSFTGFFQKLWTAAVFGVARAFTKFTGFIQKTWNTTVGFLSKAWEGLKEMVTGARGKSGADIDAETLQANQQVDTDRQDALSELDAEQARREKERRDATAGELSQNDDALRKARAELAATIRKAAVQSKEDDAGLTKTRVNKIRDTTSSGTALDQKTVVEGTLTGFERFAGFGVRDKDDEIIHQLRKIERNTAEKVGANL